MVFKTRSNYYLYSSKHNRILLIDPRLAQVIEAKEKPSKNNGNQLQTNKRKWNFYLKKYDLLKQNGYFDPPDVKQRISGRYTGDLLRAHLHKNRQIVFEVTDACNLKCKYCGYGEFYSGYDKRTDRDLSIHKAKTLLDYMTGFWNSPKNIFHEKGIRIGFYGGEPLMNFSFVKETVGYARDIKLENNHFTFGMTTNGILLNKYIDWLVENRFRLLISLDGDESCNRYRVFHNGNPAFQAIYRNICLIRDKYPEYFREHVRFSAVLHHLNSIEKIYTFFETHFHKIPSVSNVSPIGIKESMRDRFEKIYVNPRESFSQAGPQVKDRTIQALRGEDVRRAADILYHFSDDTVKELGDVLPDTRHSTIPSGTCMPLNRKMFLNVNGKILPCERVPAFHVLGSVDEKGVQIDFDQIAEKYNRYFDRLHGQCSVCSATKKCSNCILQMDVQNGGFKCPAFTGPEDFKRFLSEGTGFLEQHPGLYKKIVKEYFLE